MGLGIHRSAAAGAAVADGVEPAKHDVLEKSVGDMTASLFRLDYPDGLVSRDLTGLVRVVFKHEGGERITDKDTHVDRGARIFHARSTGAVQQDNLFRVVEDDFAGAGVRKNLFRDLGVHCTVYFDQLDGFFQRQRFAMVRVPPGHLLLIGVAGFVFVIGQKRPVPVDEKDQRRPQIAPPRFFVPGQAYVVVTPASVNVAVDEIEKGEPLFSAIAVICDRGLFDERYFHGES